MANCSRPGASLTLPSAMASVFPSPPPPLVATLDGDSLALARALRALARQGDVGEDDHGPARRGEGAAGAGGDAELEEFHRGGVCGATASARRRRALHDYASANLVRATAPARKAATTVAMRLILSSLPARSDDEASMA